MAKTCFGATRKNESRVATSSFLFFASRYIKDLLKVHKCAKRRGRGNWRVFSRTPFAKRQVVLHTQQNSAGWYGDLTKQITRRERGRGAKSPTFKTCLQGFQSFLPYLHPNIIIYFSRCDVLIFVVHTVLRCAEEIFASHLFLPLWKTLVMAARSDFHLTLKNIWLQRGS